MTLIEVEQMFTVGASLDEMLAALERVELPEDAEYRRLGMRIHIADVHCVAAPPLDDIAAYIAAAPPLGHHAPSLVAWCVTWPELIPRYLPALIDELANVTDPMLTWWAERARAALARYK